MRQCDDAAPGEGGTMGGCYPHGMFHEGSRTLQDGFGTRLLADRIDEKFVKDHIDAGDRAFIERADMLFLATADGQGRPSCSYKGGEPGFVRVVDGRTIAFPNYDGNGMFSRGGTPWSIRRWGCCSSTSSG